MAEFNKSEFAKRLRAILDVQDQAFQVLREATEADRIDSAEAIKDEDLVARAVAALQAALDAQDMASISGHRSEESANRVRKAHAAAMEAAHTANLAIKALVDELG